MRFLSTVGLLAALLSVQQSQAATSPSIARALPPSARSVSAISVPGATGKWAVTYQVHGWNVGAVDVAGAKPRLLWHRSISGAPSSLSTPGAAGLFRLLAVAAPGGAETVYAYEILGGGVLSAVAGNASGEIVGDEGASLSSGGFLVRTRDEDHAGSVPYRFVIRFRWKNGAYHHYKTIRVPDYPTGQYPTPDGVVQTQHGDTILLRLQVADTALEQELGLMYRKSLDPDGGMIFVWRQLVQVSFWMENTLIPLSIAFVGTDGTIHEILDMQPQTTDLHTPKDQYQYAIEVNQGFYQDNGIRVGDRFTFDLTSTTFAGK
jgi:uncharacterized protein